MTGLVSGVVCEFPDLIEGNSIPLTAVLGNSYSFYQLPKEADITALRITVTDFPNYIMKSVAPCWGRG